MKFDSPKDFIGFDMRSTFGMYEYEEAIYKIVRYLADDDAKLEFMFGMGEYPAAKGTGWSKLFRVNTVPEIDSALFAMLCADGWIVANYFPKYTFSLSQSAIARLREKALKRKVEASAR